ncbi:MAG: two-component system cell cycle response regulator [Pseudohongiellaceae bacterium]
MATSIQLDAQSLVEILTDDATSLLNHEFFQMRLEEEFKKSWRYGWSYTLLVFDIEGFEEICERDGDRAGLGLELAIAGEILNASRDIDLSTRIEGGRFMVLLPGCDTEGARAFVQRVLTDNVVQRAEGRFSVSAGGSCSPQSGLDSLDEFEARAATGLVKAKEMGDNQFVIWNEASI